ncbi:hypothetical protein [Terrarubrum flagellatum]|uniref:hypothetical protein n=1 Tax=Terrirubrum flagellatum TaxID=2895980 RepID=UPI0031455E88
MDEAKKPPPFKWAPGFADAIANIANRWAHLEFYINYSIWLLAGLDAQRGACLTSQMYTLQAKLSAMKSLLEFADAPKELVTRVNKFAESIRGPQEMRNRALHDMWLMDNEDAAKMARLEIVAPGKLKFEPKPYEARGLEEVLAGIVIASKEANSIRLAIYELKTLPPRHPSLTDPMEVVV